MYISREIIHGLIIWGYIVRKELNGLLRFYNYLITDLNNSRACLSSEEYWMKSIHSSELYRNPFTFVGTYSYFYLVHVYTTVFLL